MKILIMSILIKAEGKDINITGPQKQEQEMKG
jgi:hypothetical protein